MPKDINTPTLQDFGDTDMGQLLVDPQCVGSGKFIASKRDSDGILNGKQSIFRLWMIVYLDYLG